MSERTKSLKSKCGWCLFFHIICSFGPLLIFTIIGFASAQGVQRVALTLSLMTAIILALISFVVSAKHRVGLQRTIMWTMVIGLMYCLKSVEAFIWILAITSILDECLLYPLVRSLGNKLTINKEIDKANQ